MTAGGAEQRLAEIYAELGRLGLRALVMGGHAVRFYGVDRSTIDFDLVIALDVSEWRHLPRILAASPMLAASREGQSWRPDDFRRFEIGSLPDGRPERLEFWRRNHLLASFDALEARKVVGRYGGGEVGFLGLDDLIRSKETEREDAPAVPIGEAIGDEAIRSLLTGVLTTVQPGGARHLALVEAVRRLYQRRCMAADRADKERTRSA